MQCFLLCQSAY